jgi:hypothetical protein
LQKLQKIQNIAFVMFQLRTPPLDLRDLHNTVRSHGERFFSYSS